MTATIEAPSYEVYVDWRDSCDNLPHIEIQVRDPVEFRFRKLDQYTYEGVALGFLRTYRLEGVRGGFYDLLPMEDGSTANLMGAWVGSPYDRPEEHRERAWCGGIIKYVKPGLTTHDIVVYVDVEQYSRAEPSILHHFPRFEGLGNPPSLHKKLLVRPRENWREFEVSAHQSLGIKRATFSDLNLALKHADTLVSEIRASGGVI